MILLASTLDLCWSFSQSWWSTCLLALILWFWHNSEHPIPIIIESNLKAVGLDLVTWLRFQSTLMLGQRAFSIHHMFIGIGLDGPSRSIMLRAWWSSIDLKSVDSILHPVISKKIKFLSLKIHLWNNNALFSIDNVHELVLELDWAICQNFICIEIIYNIP